MSVRNKIVYIVCALALISVPVDAIFFSEDIPTPGPVEHNRVITHNNPSTLNPTNIYDEFAANIPRQDDPVISTPSMSVESEMDKLITERAEEIAGEMIDGGYRP